MSDFSVWDALPPYSVRTSRRAKRLRLQVTPAGRIEVVLPEGVDPSRVAAFVAAERDWIARALCRIGAPAPAESVRPEHIYFTAIDERWTVDYDPAARRLAASHSRLHLRLPEAGIEASKLSLCRWLKAHAARRLAPWLHEVSAELGLPFNKVSVRLQRTRWGSCSSKKNINLNANLLFLSPQAVRYLFIHELCHTQHMNHSRRYWALVEKYAPDYRQSDRLLRRGFRQVPQWALP